MEKRMFQKKFFSKFSRILSILYLFAVLIQQRVLANDSDQVFYNFSTDPIDVVIPCTSKDLVTLEKCIEGIKNNCSQIRRVIVVSSNKLTDNAEWFDEKNYPFDKFAVACHLFHGDEKAAYEFCQGHSRIGWYYQQLLKLYAPYIIPDISENVLILDSDTIFLNPVIFLNSEFAGLYNTGHEYNPAYFVQANSLIPGFKKYFSEYSGITHHMLFQRCILNDLFQTVEKHHQMEFWKAFCESASHDNNLFAGASEYEIYFNFAFKRTSQVKIRPLYRAEIRNLNEVSLYQAQGFHYISCHSYLRGD